MNNNLFILSATLTVVITLLPAQSLVSRTDQWLFNKLLRHTSHATL